MYILARTLNTEKKFPEAEKYARDAVALRERLGGAETAEVAKAQLVLGRALIGQNKLTEAETLLRRALTVSEKRSERTTTKPPRSWRRSPTLPASADKLRTPAIT